MQDYQKQQARSSTYDDNYKKKVRSHVPSAGSRLSTLPKEKLSASGKPMPLTIKPGMGQCGAMIFAKTERAMDKLCMKWGELWIIEEDDYGGKIRRNRCREHGGQYDADGKQILSDKVVFSNTRSKE